MEINHINNLRTELNDIIDLNEGLKTNILNIFTSWYSCKSKHSYITNINDSVINLNKKIDLYNDIHSVNIKYTIRITYAI